MSTALLMHGKAVVVSKEDKTKRYKKRIKDAIRLLSELDQCYIAPGVKDIFASKIYDADRDVQFFALVGLEHYYAYSEADKITEEEAESIEDIIETTPTRETASTCCQILINAGKIDEFGAVMRMDRWKDRNWGRRFA